MTLIAAFRCDVDGSPGVIICADSQESYGAYRVTVDKIKPRDANRYDLIVGGAGNVGALIDGLSNTIERWVKSWPADVPEEVAREQLEMVVKEYYENQIAAYPAPLDDKRLQFIICVRDKHSTAIYLWKADGPTVESIVEHDLIGWEEPLYKYEVKRLYGHVKEASAAMALGIHLLSLGKATAASIDKPFQVIGVHKDFMWVEPAHAVEALEAKVRQTNETLSRLITAAHNVSVSDEKFEGALRLFEREILGLREAVAQVNTARATVRLPSIRVRGSGVVGQPPDSETSEGQP